MKIIKQGIRKADNLIHVNKLVSLLLITTALLNLSRITVGKGP